MKHSFKLLIAVISMAAYSALAQVHVSQNLLNATVTDIKLKVGAVGITNGYYIGTVFTNSAGVQKTQTNNIATDSATEYINLCGAANLWSDRDGNPPFIMVTNNLVATTPAVGAMNVTVKLTGAAAGAGSAVTFQFKPLFDGVNASTETGDLWTFTVTANGATPVVQTVNVPIWKFAGAKKLQLYAVSNADADTEVVLNDLTLNGFMP